MKLKATALIALMLLAACEVPNYPAPGSAAPASSVPSPTADHASKPASPVPAPAASQAPGPVPTSTCLSHLDKDGKDSGWQVCVPLPGGAKPLPKPSAGPVASPVPSGEYHDPIQAINAIVAASPGCSGYSFKDRSRAPLGFLKGMARTFGRSACRYLSPATTAAGTMGQVLSSSDKDALAWYGLSEDTGLERIRLLYTLGIGLGMRESSGKYCEGWDTSAESMSETEAEAGLFQTSYNAAGSYSVARALQAEYAAHPDTCLLEVFKEGVVIGPKVCAPGSRNQSIVGSGSGAAYQRLAKSCPAYATESSMAILRLLRKHWGPINRKEAEVNAACGQMLSQVQALIELDPKGMCAAL